MLTLNDRLTAFSRDDSGAATTDWVVITGMLVGLAIATATMVYEGSGNTTLQLSGLLDTTESIRFQEDGDQLAQHFYDIGIAAYPSLQDDAWRTARLAVHESAPAGFEYDPGLTTTRYVDLATGYPIYVSSDGLSYSIGGQIIAAAEYDASNRISFRNGFNAYFNAT